MITPTVDPSQALQDAAQSSLAQRKLDMDALRGRFGDTATRNQKLREACEGFEAIFLQKIWKQMRKNVPKDYLHSKDQETYQSMFDIELSKKMASAGGIGLADMLYAQLSQQLEDTGRTTRPSASRQFLPIPPAEGLLPSPPGSGVAAAGAAAPVVPPADVDKKLTIESLYSPLDQEPLDGEFTPPGVANVIANALDDLRAELGIRDAPGAAARDWAAARDAATGLGPFPATPVDTANPSSVQNAMQNADILNVAQGDPLASPAVITPSVSNNSASNIAGASWLGPGPVSARPRPIQSFARPSGADRAEQAGAPAGAAARQPALSSQPGQPGMAPGETLWPLPGAQSAVTSQFGWEDDPASGTRRWNSGVWIAAAPGMPVRAVLPGTVVYAGPREGHGHTVVLEHRDGYRSYYSNLAPDSVRIGDKVRHGAEFARVASQPSPAVNGENSASLHFELKKGEMALNPESAITRS